MARQDEKIIVDVRDGERGSVVYKDVSGEEHTYWPAKCTYFVLEDLQTSTYLAEPGEGETEPEIKKSIRGLARVECRSLSVIGDPAWKTTTLEMSLEASDWRPDRDPRHDAEIGGRSKTFVGGANMGFTRRDWELGNKDEWWGACYLPQAFIDRIEAAILAGNLTGVRLGVAFRGLYSDRSEWEYSVSRSNLFLMPQEGCNDVTYPQIAAGFVTSIAFTTTKTDLRLRPTNDARAHVQPVEQSPPPLPNEAITDGVAELAARLEATRSTIKWAAGFITMALLLLATVRG